MLKRNVFITICVLSLVVFFSGCGSDDEGTKGSITAEFDGQELSVKFSSAILEKGIDYDEPARTLNITGMVGDKPLSIAVSGWDFINGHPDDGVLVKKYYADTSNFPEAECENNGAITLCEMGLVTYFDGTFLYMSELTGGYEGYVEITSCNSSKKKVSGKYHAMIAKNSGEDGKIMEGEFKNLSYVIIE